jgi:hypothetical protein
MMKVVDGIIGFQRDGSRCVRAKDCRPPISSLFLQLLLLLLLILILLSSSCAGPDTTDWSGITIEGKLVDDGGHPVEGAHVYAYSQGKSNTLGPAEGMSEPTGADGAYILVLPEGVYTLVARRRMSGSISGPLRNGDMSGQMSKPIQTGPGDRTGVNITLTVFRQGSDGDPNRILNTYTRIKGMVTDPDGKVMDGTHVFAYRGAFRSDPPDILSPASGLDGQFEISLPGGGFYTIGARTGLRGKPRPEDSIGFWGGKDQQWDIKEGTVTEGVRIVVVPYGDTGTR